MGRHAAGSGSSDPLVVEALARLPRMAAGQTGGRHLEHRGALGWPGPEPDDGALGWPGDLHVA